MNFVACLVFVVAATLEVGGDAIIRRGLRSEGMAIVALGMCTVALYGLVVNIVSWDFSRLLGVYVAFFASLSFFIGCFAFGDRPPPTAWFGLILIIIGGLLIQSAETGSH
jgi:small multidrug resistance family-3 protein